MNDDLLIEARNALDVLAVLTESRPGNVRLNALDTLTCALKVTQADARALWAVKVLDRAYVRFCLGEPIVPQVNEAGEWAVMGPHGEAYRAGSAMAARIAAAEALVAEDTSLGEGL